GKAPEQEGPAPPEGRACMRPRGFDAHDVGANLVAKCDRLDRPAEIRRACLSQCDEARMHFACERAGMSASGFALRPHRLSGKGLRKVFDDRKRLPNRDLAVL